MYRAIQCEGIVIQLASLRWGRDDHAQYREDAEKKENKGKESDQSKESEREKRRKARVACGH